MSHNLDVRNLSSSSTSLLTAAAESDRHRAGRDRGGQAAGLRRGVQALLERARLLHARAQVCVSVLCIIQLDNQRQEISIEGQ